MDQNGPLPMAKPRPEKKRQEAPGQPAEQRSFRCSSRSATGSSTRPGTWEVASRPYTTEEDAHVRVKKVCRPDVTEIRIWGAREHVSVRRL
jgi:hypothetical protein